MTSKETYEAAHAVSEFLRSNTYDGFSGPFVANNIQEEGDTIDVLLAPQPKLIAGDDIWDEGLDEVARAIGRTIKIFYDQGQIRHKLVFSHHPGAF